MVIESVCTGSNQLSNRVGFENFTEVLMATGALTLAQLRSQHGDSFMAIYNGGTYVTPENLDDLKLAIIERGEGVAGRSVAPDDEFFLSRRQTAEFVGLIGHLSFHTTIGTVLYPGPETGGYGAAIYTAGVLKRGRDLAEVTAMDLLAASQQRRHQTRKLRLHVPTGVLGCSVMGQAGYEAATVRATTIDDSAPAARRVTVSGNMPDYKRYRVRQPPCLYPF